MLTPSERERLSAQFDAEMQSIYDRASSEIGYHPTSFLAMLRQRGGVATAEALLQPRGPVPEGFTRLALEQRLDLSVEHLVQQEPWCHLFAEETLSVARLRLKRS